MNLVVKKIWELKTNQEIEAVNSPLSEEEFLALKRQIEERGLLKPIDIMPDGTIVDGHHRYKACKELGIEDVTCNILPISTITEAKEYTGIVNVTRRNSNKFQKAKTGYVLLQIERQKARERQLSTLKKGILRSHHGDANGEKGKAVQIIAEKIGLSPSTFERAIVIIERAPKKIQDLVEQEKMPINTAYELTVALENEDAPVPEEVKKDLWDRVIYSEDPVKEARKVTQIITNTNAVKEIIEMEDEEIAKKIKETWEDKFYTEELDVDEVRDNINVWTGGTGKLEKVYLPYEKFADEENPDEMVARYFAHYGGHYLDKITVTVYVGEVNRYLWKKRDELDKEFEKVKEKVREEIARLKKMTEEGKKHGKKE